MKEAIKEYWDDRARPGDRRAVIAREGPGWAAWAILMCYSCSARVASMNSSAPIFSSSV